MKKFVISLVFIFSVPLCVCLLFWIDPQNKYNYRFVVSALLYLLLIIDCLKYLKKLPIPKRSVLLAVLTIIVVVGYTTPITWIAVLAAIATSLVLLKCLDGEWDLNRFLIWARNDIASNIRILSGITLTFFIISIIQRKGDFNFQWSAFRSSLAAAFSEELIFHVYLPVCLYKRLDNNDNPGNKIWAFFSILVPFILLHLLDNTQGYDIQNIIRTSLSITGYSGVLVLLINRFGIIYGIYAHFLIDFISMSFI